MVVLVTTSTFLPQPCPHFKHVRKANGWPRFALSTYSTNGGPQWVVVLPFVSLNWQRQREMWFRDLFYRARVEEEALERTISRLRRELSQVRGLANTPADGAVQ